MNKFVKYLKEQGEKNIKELKPRFKKGDVIRNEKFKTVAKVLNVSYNAQKNINDPQQFYVLLYFKNPHADPAKASEVGINGTYTKFKMISKIDGTYDLVDEKLAAILYKSKKEYENAKTQNRD